jgi:hypothetical protein
LDFQLAACFFVGEESLLSVCPIHFTSTSYLLCHWLPLCTPPHFLCVTVEIAPKILLGKPKLVPMITWYRRRKPKD